MRKYKAAVLTAFLAVAYSWGAGVSYPSAPVPAARFASGISYDYNGGYLALMGDPEPAANTEYTQYGMNAFFTYGLADYINVGFDLGLKDVNIKSAIRDYPSFYGRMGIATGPHVKLATPYGGDVFALVGFYRMQWFYSENSGHSIYHSGMDFTASGAFSFHVRDFGYISSGVKYFEIFGEKDLINPTPGIKTDNVWGNDLIFGGWIAFDYFPKASIKKYLPFVSVELGFFPHPKDSKNDSKFFGRRPAVRNISLSVTVGGITNRLYGDSGKDWRP